MSQSLYRKYRPQTFKDLTAQEYIKTTIQNAISSQRIGHAYLFSGPRGVGKTTIARLIAKTLNCLTRNEALSKGEKAESEPCNVCQVCLEITDGRSLDVIEIDAASNRGIDEIRELREKIKFSPTISRYKVFIIDEVHMLTKEAFNALLKTLEEPPSHAIFILATTELHKVPLTIASRCQEFIFKKAKEPELISRLGEIARNEKISVTESALNFIARLGDGSFRDAISILDQVRSFKEDEIDVADLREILGLASEEQVFSFLIALAEGDSKTAFEILSLLKENGADLHQFTQNAIEALRKILIFKINPEILSGEQGEFLAEIAGNFDEPLLIEMINKFIEAGGLIKRLPFPELPLEMLISHYSRIKQKDTDPDSTPSASGPVRNKSLRAAVAAPTAERTSNGVIKRTVPVSDVSDSDWQNVLEGLKENNHSLYMILKEVREFCFENDCLILSFPFKFHAERLAETKNRLLVEKILEEKLGGKYRLDFKIVPLNQTTTPNFVTQNPVETSDGLLEEVKEIFE